MLAIILALTLNQFCDIGFSDPLVFIDGLQSNFMCLCMNSHPSGSEADTVLSRVQRVKSEHLLSSALPVIERLGQLVKAQSHTSFSKRNAQTCRFCLDIECM